MTKERLETMSEIDKDSRLLNKDAAKGAFYLLIALMLGLTILFALFSLFHYLT